MTKMICSKEEFEKHYQVELPDPVTSPNYEHVTSRRCRGESSSDICIGSCLLLFPMCMSVCEFVCGTSATVYHCLVIGPCDCTELHFGELKLYSATLFATILQITVCI